MAKVLSWKTIVVGAGMVAMASFFDFDHTGEQIKILRGLRACKVSYTTLSADSLTKALREHAKKNHPDLGGVSEIGACTVDETNELRAGVRKHGVGWLAWILYKLNIAPSRVETAIMFTFIGAGCVCTAAVRRLPPRYSRWLVTLGLLASRGDGLNRKTTHEEAKARGVHLRLATVCDRMWRYAESVHGRWLDVQGHVCLLERRRYVQAL